MPGTPLHKECVDAGAIPADYWDRFVRGEFDVRLNHLVPDAEARARYAYRSFFLRPQMAKSLIGHAMTTGQWRNTASGLMSLAKSNNNTDRDF